MAQMAALMTEAFKPMSTKINTKIGMTRCPLSNSTLRASGNSSLA